METTERDVARSGREETTMSETDLYLWRAAELLVKLHGDDAPRVAGERAARLLNTGDTQGCHEWRRLLVATKSLLSRDNCAAA
jgi:hypothetical protein